METVSFNDMESRMMKIDKSTAPPSPRLIPLPAGQWHNVAGGRSLPYGLLPAPIYRVQPGFSRGWIPAPSPQPGIR